jgi:hypothetical protein
MFDSMPLANIQQVLMNLSTFDLKHMMLVNKNFYRIIVNNEKLMEKFRLYVRVSTKIKGMENLPQRKYVNMHIDFQDDLKKKTLIQAFAGNIKDLVLCGEAGEMPIFWFFFMCPHHTHNLHYVMNQKLTLNVLNRFPNCTVLQLNKIGVYDDHGQISTIDLSILPKLKKLSLNNSHAILVNKQLESIEVGSNLVYVEKLLFEQQNLKNLAITSLQHDFEAEKYIQKNQILQVENFSISYNVCEVSMDIIKVIRPTKILEFAMTYEIEGYEVYRKFNVPSAVLLFDLLLHNEDVDFQTYIPNPNVVKIAVMGIWKHDDKNDKLKDLLHLFPNTTTLDLKSSGDFSMTTEVFMIVVKELPKLKKIVMQTKDSKQLLKDFQSETIAIELC